MHASDADLPAGITQILIREGSTWLAAAPGSALQETDSGEIAAWLHDVALPSDHEPVSHDALITPVPVFTLGIGGGRLLLGQADRAFVTLDAQDLSILDAIIEPRSIASILRDLSGDADDASRVDDLRRRLARLVATGRFNLSDPPGQLATEPVATIASSGAAPDRWFDRLRRRKPPTAAAPRPDNGRVPAAVVPTADHNLYIDTPGLERPESGAPPVYAVWRTDSGPQLSLGMLVAYARTHDDGRLANTFDLRRPEEPSSFIADVVARSGPAVLLLSNYVWTLDHNLDLARQAKARNPELVVIHGGPSTPKYEADCRRFFDENADVVDVAVRGEGEITLAEALSAMGPALDLDGLATVEGLTYRTSAGDIVRTAERERVADLNSLPSPYLTGEFDHLHPSCWQSPTGLQAVIIESNRGCPYGCTFCDWGSATLSRIRKFDLDRVEAEMHWLAERGLDWWMVADANFGIMARDVEFAERLVAVNRQHGVPVGFAFNVAKNTTKHLTKIIGILVDANVTPNFSLSLQTIDEGTLEAIERTNISSDHYVALAASFRRLGLPLHADLMLGLPGQTVDSFSDDLQFLMDQGMTARIWISVLLPNSPMNDPAYRDEHGVTPNDLGTVMATSSFDTIDRLEMRRIQDAYVTFERHPLLRLVLRYVQWDHEVPATQVLRRVIDGCTARPDDYPLLAFSLEHFHDYRLPPVGWDLFFAEVRRFLAEEFDIAEDSGLEAVLEAQRLLLPDHGRSFPRTRDLEHDVIAYYREHTAHQWTKEVPASPTRRLTDHGPAPFTVHGDPLDHCNQSLAHHTDPYVETMQSEHWVTGQWELDSPIVFFEPAVSGSADFMGLGEQIDHWSTFEPIENATHRQRVQVNSHKSTA